jgi:hypothetical protein
MRVLLACSLGGSGHLTPVVNVARAVRRLGHDAVVLVPPSLVSEIERAGLPYEVGGEPPRAVIDQTWERVRGGPPEQVVGLIDRELFADHCTQAMLPAARSVCDRRRPDLLVRESCEDASAIAAATAGIAHAQDHWIPRRGPTAGAFARRSRLTVARSRTGGRVMIGLLSISPSAASRVCGRVG